MSNTPNHDSPEQLADSKQAQVIIDEVDRILAGVRLSPGLSGTKHAPSKMRWHEGLFFIQHPDGQQNVDNPDTLDLVSV